MKKLAIVLLVGIVFVIAAGVIGCAGKETVAPTPEPTIPPNFTTYINDAGIFSISYPDDWEAPLWLVEDVEQWLQEYITSINLDLSIEKTQMLFIAGQPIEDGWYPNINIVVEPRPGGMSSLDAVLEEEIQGLKSIITDFQELSRSKTTVGGEEAAIVEFEGFFSDMDEVHDLQMYIIKGKTIWVVTCTAGPDDYSDFEATFYSALRSFRIWK